MPEILDYDRSFDLLTQQGFRCLYHNSGAFGFAPGQRDEVVGWIGKEDPSLKPEARSWAKLLAGPVVPTLVQLATKCWQELLPGEVWVMPKSHWGFELTFGAFEWLPGVFAEVGIDIEALRPRNNGSPIEFKATETQAFAKLLSALLANLDGSDFMLAFPGRATVCSVHHHKQLWWQTTNMPLAQSLRNLIQLSASE